MSKSKDTSTMQTITYPTLRSKAAVGEQFIDVMQEYQQRQEDDPNFDPSTRLYDLYDELTFIYDLYKDKSND